MPRKLSYLILTVIVALQCGAMLYWASMKASFFIDEYYTFEYTQNINDHKDHIDYLVDSPMWKAEEWVPVGELKKRFTLEEGESVLDLPFFKSVKKFFFDRNYMWIINVLETCFGNGNPPKWICICFNVFVWILFQFLLFYFMAGCLELDRRTSLLAVTMWGFTPLVMGLAVFCRFYSWTFLLFLAVLVLHKLMWNSTSHKKNLLVEAVAFLLLYLAFKNSELIFVLGGALVIFFTVGLIARKRYAQSLYYFLPVTVVGLYYVWKETPLFKLLFNLTFYSVKGNSTEAQHASFVVDSSWMDKLNAMIQSALPFGDNVSGSPYLTVIEVVLLAFLFFSARKNLSRLNDGFFWVLVGIMIAYWLFCGIGGFLYIRYLSFLYFLVVILIWSLFDKVARNHRASKLVYRIACVLVLAGVFISFHRRMVEYVYEDYKPSIELVSDYSDLDAVVHYHPHINSNAYYSAYMLSDQSSVFPVCRFPSNGMLPELPDQFLYWASRGSSSQKVAALIKERGYSMDLLCDTDIIFVYLCDKNDNME
ncbi:MAG: hypothetical protein IKW89_06210 [Bacteroidales bacterium]|nr:hypothetical protein [Bacteroidales bacterium]